MENYAVLSLETHLYFARIMKEHSLFLMAGFPCKDESWIKKADWFREQFEDLLRDVVRMSDQRVTASVLRSDELTTEFTIPAEERTSNLSGVPIDTQITCDTKELRARENRNMNYNMSRNMNHHMSGNANRNMNRNMNCRNHSTCPNDHMLFQQVRRINERALQLVNGLIDFKERLLQEVNNCKIFNANYPLLIQHIIREAKLYRDTIMNLQQNRTCTYEALLGTETFWNQIMMEHALLIRGLLDPTECQLINTANDFAMDYKKLLEMAKEKDCEASEELTKRTLEKTIEYSKFKAAGTEGILDCKIASIILPLLADHVLREANHYIRILKIGSQREEI